jgi:dipeptidyl aminopeptidase/acylaminoacyl peptidase
VSENTSRRRLSAEDLWAIPRVGVPAPAPDGSFVVVGVTTYPDGDIARERLWLVPMGGGEPHPLTPPDLVSLQPAPSPDGDVIAFVGKAIHDRGHDKGIDPAAGGEAQLHVMPRDGGEPRRITDLPMGVSDPRWLPDGRRVVVISRLYRDALGVEATRRLRDARAKAGDRPHVTEDRVFRLWDRWLTDGEVHHVFVVDVETGDARDLTPASDQWFDLMDPAGDLDVAPGGEEIAYCANVTPPPYVTLRAGIHTVPVAGGAPRCVSTEETADARRPRYSPDGRWLVYGTKRDPQNYADRVRLVRLDRTTGARTTLTEAWDHSPVGWEFSGPDTLLIEVVARGRTRLCRMSVAEGGTPEVVFEGGTLHGARPASDGFVYAQHSTLARPPEVARVPATGGAVEVLTRFTAEALAGLELGCVEEIDFAGGGGDPVHMYVVFPPGHAPGSPSPLVQILHGGPYGAHVDGWSWRWNTQVLAAPGHVLALVNFHGSESYGERFADAIRADWGGKAAEDVLLATDLLVAREIADPARLALAGGSFGGYMASWLPTRTDRFACAVVHAPVYNLAAICSTDVTQGFDDELGGEPWATPRGLAAIDRWNPAAHTGSYRTPTLVTHGERDFRCTVQNGLELYGMLKAKGVPARLAHYPDENHWILKRRSSLHWYGEVLGWLARWLRA